jgi:hypothetical protein
MNHQQLEKYKELKRSIETHYQPRQRQNIPSFTYEPDLLWDASRFWAQIALVTTVDVSTQTMEHLEAFALDYARQTGINISLSDLFKEHWLRKIVNSVMLAHAIRSILYEFEKMRPFKQELQFLSSFYRTKGSRQQVKVPLGELESAAKQHESDHQVTLNRAGIFSNRWAHLEEDQVQISAMDVYFDPVLTFWDRLEFLYQWRSTVVDPSTLSIPKKALESIYQTHTLFGNAPSIDLFVAEGAFTSMGDTYGVNLFRHQQPHGSIFTDKIAGWLWELLNRDDSYPTDRERLVVWMDKVLRDGLWPDHLDHVTSSGNSRFLDAALQLLLNEEDLVGCESELSKVFFDSSEKLGATVLFGKTRTVFDAYSLNDSNLFELYQSFYVLEHLAHTNWLYEQGSRHALAFLIHSIVRYETEPIENATGQTGPSRAFPQIKTLLRKGIERPFLVWSIVQAIKFRRPGVLPSLLTEHDLCTFALSVLDQLEFSIDKDLALSEVWPTATQLLLQNLPTSAEHKPARAELVFQLFRELNKDKYSIPTPKTISQQERSLQQQTERRQQVMELLENAPINPFPARGASPQYLLPELLDLLSQHFVDYREKQVYRTGAIQFPMPQWDGIFWLIKLTTYWKYREAIPANVQNARSLAELFLRQYLASLEQEEIKVYDYFEEKEKIDLPHWSERIERLQLLDWVYPIYNIHKAGRLNGFLSPRIELNPAGDIYDKTNNLLRDKLRTHLGVLLQILRKLAVPVIPYGFEKEKLLEIKNKIEDQVITYIGQYSVDLPEEGRLDLFTYQKERSIHHSDTEALLPQIAQAINWFSKKEGVINALSATGDIVKLLILLDYVTVEGIKQTLIHRIETMDLVDFLDSRNWIPEIETVLFKLALYPELLPQLERATNFWSEKVTSRQREHDHKMSLFVAKLLIAYYKKDQTAINDVIEPDTPFSNPSQLSYYAYKQFYHALLHIANDPAKASQAFGQLVRQYPTYPSFALNRMVAHSNLAAQQDSRDLYRETYEEWKEHSATHFSSEVLVFLEPHLTATLMTILLALEEHGPIDTLFRQLDLPNQMALPVVEKQIKSLAAQKKMAEALSLIEKARTYHQFAGFEQIQSLADLETEIRGVDNIDDLKSQYHRIFSNTPARLVRILPAALNGKEDIQEFIVNEIVLASGKMLEKIKSIEKIDNEDKYNDLIELLLDARLNPLGWHVAGQSRGGYSAPGDKTDGTQPGERDLPIMDSNKNVLLNCEALIFRGASTAASHLQKIFDYHHQRKAIAVLIYNAGKRKGGFEGNWKSYLTKILPTVSFPAGMELVGSPVEVTHDFGCEESAIKIAKSNHGSGTVIYHLFINILYKLV